jgi:DNA polymerase-3 subunit delta
MAALNAHRDLRKAIQQRTFESAYYFQGDEEFLKDEMIRQVIDAAVDPATRDFNLDLRRGGDIDAESLLSLLSTPPMMADRRLVVVRDVHALKKEPRAALDRYLAAPTPDVVALLVAPAGAITPSAVDLLISAVGNDLPQLAAELDKLASYANGAAIDDDAVSAIVGVRRGETLGDLLDRVLAHDAPGALAVIDHVLAQPKITAVSIVMALTTQMLALAWVLAIRERGVPAAGIERELYGLLKESGPYTGRPWGEAVNVWSQAVQAWRQPELDAAIDALLAADYALKESRLSSDEQIIASLVLTLCGAPRRAAA